MQLLLFILWVATLLTASQPLCAEDVIAGRMPQSRAEIAFSFAPIVKKVSPAVVNIYARKMVSQRMISPFMDDPFFQEFFGNQYPQGLTRQRVQNSLGSGVIVKSEGIVVTNNHVIEGADEVMVVLSDRREFSADVIASDKRSDLAVLKLKTKGETFPTLSFMDSDEVNTGDLVLAIGNPFGVGQTVTMGIVSAVARAADVDSGNYNYFIQTDAAINPGNSGGALVSADGRLVGIPSAIYSQNGGSLGIGFAIPSNLVRATLASVGQDGKVVHGWVGMHVQTLTGDLATSLGLSKPGGVIVRSMHPASPAAAAGLKVGDVIDAIDNRDIADEEAFNFRVGTTAVGGTLHVHVLRKDGAADLSFKVVAPPAAKAKGSTLLSGHHALAGARVEDISPALAQSLGLADDAEGVIVTGTAPRTPAALLGLQRGDFIVAVNDQEIKTVEQLAHLLANIYGPLRLSIRRGDEVLNVVVGQ